MNRALLFTTFISTAAIFVTQACSSEESTGASDAGTASATSSSGNASTSGATTSSSGESSGSEPADTCISGGGACVCGGLSAACPNGGTRDGTLKCKQGPQGSGECTKTCCTNGDSGTVPKPDGSTPSDAGNG